jgi:hypothetical protein
MRIRGFFSPRDAGVWLQDWQIQEAIKYYSRLNINKMDSETIIFDN